MLKPDYTNKFLNDINNAEKRGYQIDELKSVILKLIKEEVPLPVKYRDHSLSGKMKGKRDCHIKDDWILVYQYAECNETFIDENGKEQRYNSAIVFLRTGAHSEIFK